MRGTYALTFLWGIPGEGRWGRACRHSRQAMNAQPWSARQGSHNEKLEQPAACLPATQCQPLPRSPVNAVASRARSEASQLANATAPSVRPRSGFAPRASAQRLRSSRDEPRPPHRPTRSPGTRRSLTHGSPSWIRQPCRIRQVTLDRRGPTLAWIAKENVCRCPLSSTAAAWLA